MREKLLNSYFFLHKWQFYALRHYFKNCQKTLYIFLAFICNVKHVWLFYLLGIEILARELFHTTKPYPA